MNGDEITDDIKDLGYYTVPLSHDDATSYVEDIRGRPSANELVNKHIQMIQQLDVKAAIEKLVVTDVINAVVTSTPIRDDLVGLPESLHDYLIGLIIVYGTEGGDILPSYKQLAGPIMDISIRYQYGSNQMVSPSASEQEKMKNQVEQSLMGQAFSTGQWMMTDQPIEAARRSYSPYNRQIKNMFGFNIDEAIKYTNYFEMMLGKCRTWLLQTDEFDIENAPSSGHTMDTLVESLNKGNEYSLGSDSMDFTRDAEVIEEYYHKISDYTHTLSMTQEVLLKHLPDLVDGNKFLSFLDRMSISPFEDTEIDNFKYPFNFNLLHKYPIVKIDNRYFVPQSNGIRRALMDTFYYDLINLDGYEGAFRDTYGDYLEEWSNDLMRGLFGTENTLLNPLYPWKPYPEATDVIALTDDTLFAIECKTGKLPLELRQGKFEEIQEKINEKIGYGYEEQRLPLIKRLRDGNLNKLVVRGESLDIANYDNYQPIIVTGEPYDMVATHLIDVVIESDDILPYVVDIFDLQVMLEYFEDVSEFDDYVSKRMELFNKRVIASPDEIDYLGLYIYNDHEFPDVSENTFMMLEDMSHYVNNQIDYKFGY